MLCNEIIHEWSAERGDRDWVCMAERFTYHVHDTGLVRGALRRLHPAEPLIERGGCVYLDWNALERRELRNMKTRVAVPASQLQYGFHVYDPDGDLQASCRYVTIAAAVVSALGNGATIRDKDHSFVVWVEGKEGFLANESPAMVAGIVAERIAARGTLKDIPDHRRTGQRGGEASGGGRRPITGSYYTLTDRDVGQRSIEAFGYVWGTAEFIGVILAKDVGKRVYHRGSGPGTLQVENDQQRAARKNAEPGS